MTIIISGDTGVPVSPVTGTLAVLNGGTGVTTSTGSGANVLGTSPTITTPTISSLSSASATNLTLQSAGTTAITVDTIQNVGIGTSSPTSKLHVNGDILCSTIATGSGISTGDCSIELGGNRSSSGNAYIDFHTTAGTDFEFRILRLGGTNAITTLQQMGTSAIQVIANTAGVQLTNGATSWASISDETRKDIIEPITDGINKVLKLRAVIGKFKTDLEGKRRTFLIAQDVQKVLPEAVVECEDDNGKYLVLAITDVIPLLVASIKELKAIIDTQAERIKALEDKP